MLVLLCVSCTKYGITISSSLSEYANFKNKTFDIAVGGTMIYQSELDIIFTRLISVIFETSGWTDYFGEGLLC